ncbi:MAG TPA: prolyl aminopeptidase [Dehalococcoidia bacterium]
MPGLYPPLEPYARGMLDAGDGQRIYWETCGNPEGKPAVVLHGGPGSGCTPWHRRLFDPAAYRVVLFDQRGCGRSTPHASEPEVDLQNNTTHHLIVDIERLRERLGVDAWLVLGGSWGSTLALAYAEAYPRRVTEMILFGVTTGRHTEFDWTFRGGLARFFPEQWERLFAAAGVPDDGRDIIEVYSELLRNADPEVRRRAAEAWCLWESATPAWPPDVDELAPRFRDPAFALAFARLVTHYVRHNAWLEDAVLLQNAGTLADIPGTLITGRFDLQAPIANAWELRRVWPRAELVIVADAGHAASHPDISGEIVRATDSFAASR